ncbi:MAG: flavin monoamine oxidase family protein, partial [Mesorhizobium sp.]|nr:flavin monoamine oxidase family protein [Mesorhizobium sp.]
AALREWGALDGDLKFTSNLNVSSRRGYDRAPGGGVNGAPTPSKINGLSDVLSSHVWTQMSFYFNYVMQTTMFQPVGGMGKIGEAFAKQVADLITFNAKVTKIAQNEKGVTVTYEDAGKPGTAKEASADWCVCTIPLTILSQIDIQVGGPMKAAIGAVPYASSVKVGLQMKRRFWEEDESIFGGVSYTNLPITQISYPSTGFNKGGKGVLLGCYTWNGPNSYEFTAMTPQQRVQKAVEYGAQIHPQYKEEFENGVSWAWHRSPFTLGCAGDWTDDARKEHYNNLCQIDGRIVLAGEHASYIPAWQEGAILSSLNAITRLHQRVMQG